MSTSSQLIEHDTTQPKSSLQWNSFIIPA